MNIFDWLKKEVGCALHGHGLEFVRNIYGDEIIHSNYMRSMWKCRFCNKIELKAELFNREEA